MKNNTYKCTNMIIVNPLLKKRLAERKARIRRQKYTVKLLFINSFIWTIVLIYIWYILIH